MQAAIHHYHHYHYHYHHFKVISTKIGSSSNSNSLFSSVIFRYYSINNNNNKTITKRALMSTTSTSTSSPPPPPSLAVVTGGRSGIGKAIVDKLATFSFIQHVLVVSRSVQEEESNNNNNNNNKVIPVAADIGTSNGRQKIVQQVAKLSSSSSSSKMPLRFLIHSAGTIDPIKSILDVTEEEFEQSVKTNLQGPILLTTALYPYMAVAAAAAAENTTINDNNYDHSNVGAPTTARVLHVSSGAAHGPPPVGWSLYGITKAGFYQAFQTLDKEFCHLHDSGTKNNNKVRVGSFKPGIVDTDMQGTIRNANETDMPMVSTFHGFKEKVQIVNDREQETVFKARPPPAGALDRPENVACFVEWLLLHTTDDEFANVDDDDGEYDIRDPKLFPKWIPPENLPKET